MFQPRILAIWRAQKVELVNPKVSIALEAAPEMYPFGTLPILPELGTILKKANRRSISTRRRLQVFGCWFLVVGCRSVGCWL